MKRAFLELQKETDGVKGKVLLLKTLKNVNESKLGTKKAQI